MSEADEPHFRHNESHAIEVALTRHDEAALSIALKDAVPELVFMESAPWDTPEPAYLERIEDHGVIREVHIIPREDGIEWRIRKESRPGYAYIGKWKLWTDYRIGFMWMHERLAYAYKPGEDAPPLEILYTGRFLSSQVRHDEKATRLRRKVWRVVKKLASNRLGVVPAGRLDRLEPSIPPFDIWAGHDAMAWALESPERVYSTFGFKGDFEMRQGWRRVEMLRPGSDYRRPDTPWHRDLQAKLEARYGPGLADLPRFHRRPWRPGDRP